MATPARKGRESRRPGPTFGCGHRSQVFRKRVEDHQLERLAVGLAAIPEEELVVGILNRLDMSRYAMLARDYFDNERRGIADLPAASSTLWREVKDAQILRFRGTGGGNLESVFLSRADDIKIDGNEGRGRGGREGRGGRGGRSGRGTMHTVQDEKGPPDSKSTESSTTKSVSHADIVCWTCHMKGHRSSNCPHKRVHFTAVEDEAIYITSVASKDHQSSNNQNNTDGLTSIFLIDTSDEHDTTILLDTQASVHIFCSIEAVSDIRNADKPVTIQGITGDRVRVTMEGDIKEIGLRGYFSQSMSANIVSYSKLKETHDIRCDKDTDMFTAIPTEGPTLTFTCVHGHYTMNLATVVHTYVTTIDTKVLKYSAKQFASASRPYEFMQRMGYIRYKAAAEIIQRGSMTNFPFTGADLVITQDIYGTPADYQLGPGVQQTVKMREIDRIPLHQSVQQELQVDLFYFLGQTFFLSISVILGLIMVTHLGPGTEKVVATSQTIEGSRSKAGQALILHIQQYLAKGFQINLITSDGEGAVKAV